MTGAVAAWAWEDRDARRALVWGSAAALVVAAIPFLRFVFGYLTILIHEFGHSVAGWAFGYPSIPAFDFSYGGGVTVHQDRSLGLTILLTAGWAALGWFAREHRKALTVVAVGAAVWAVLAFTPAHEAIQIAAGHAAELVLAGLFLFRAMHGEACRIKEERPLYAFCGTLIVLHNLRFAWGLATSPLERDLYADAKGGGHWMDFSRLAEEFLHVELKTVAALFFLLCLATVAGAFVADRRRSAAMRRIQAESDAVPFS